MSLKVSRKLFNHYNKIFEVIFEDGTVVEGNYAVQLQEKNHNSPFTTANFVVTAFPKYSQGLNDEYVNIASYSIEEHIKNRIERMIIENF